MDRDYSIERISALKGITLPRLSNLYFKKVSQSKRPLIGRTGFRQSKGKHMSDENEVSVEQETAQAALPAEESKSAQELQKAEAFARKSHDDQDRNWKEARRKMQELERKSREQEEVIQRLSAPKAEEDELSKLGDEDIITYGQHKKATVKLAKQIAEQVIKEREAATVDERLQNKYSDFAQVVTKENIELLKETEPELAESLGYNPDPFKQGVAVYKLLKKASVGATEMVEKLPPKEKEKAIQNSQKPMSVNAVTKQSAIGNAHLFENGLTKELKASLFKEMREAAKHA